MALGALIWQTAHTAPANLWVLVAMLGLALLIEGIYRLAGRNDAASEVAARGTGNA